MAAWSQFKVFIVRHRRPRLGRDCKPAACVSARSGQHRHLARRFLQSLLEPCSRLMELRSGLRGGHEPTGFHSGSRRGRRPRRAAAAFRALRGTAAAAQPPCRRRRTTPRRRHHRSSMMATRTAGLFTVEMRPSTPRKASRNPRLVKRALLSSTSSTSGNGASGFGRSGARSSAAAILTGLLALSHARESTQK